ncbi:MAG: hypothetical protein LBL45_02845 [Treponema sp.]|jgi:hypothetical protein|nr:hypothetical protein [Treponema sp.]
MAKAIKDYILTGQTSTTDTGDYSGKGTGTMTINDSQLQGDFRATFEAKYNDDDLASHMATDSDNACKANDTVQENSSGTVITPSGASSSFSGPAVGKFSGDKSLIATPLKGCFQTMRGMMAAGGNELYAAQLAIAADAYLKAGAITVQLKSPFVSGSGSGKIA